MLLRIRGSDDDFAITVLDRRLLFIAKDKRFHGRPDVLQVSEHVAEQLRVFCEEHRNLALRNGVPNDGRGLAPLTNSGFITDDERTA